MDLQHVLGHIMAARGTGTASIVWVPGNEPDVIKPVIDMAAGLLVPRVNSAAEVERAVAACHYPPRGTHGIDYRAISQSDYLELAEEQTMVLVQIEHVDAVRNMDDLLHVPGLDGVCVGPNDLSGSMNKLGQIDHPEVVAAIDEVLQKTSRTDVFAGISVGYDSVSFAAWIEKGV